MKVLMAGVDNRTIRAVKRHAEKHDLTIVSSEEETIAALENDSFDLLVLDKLNEGLMLEPAGACHVAEWLAQNPSHLPTVIANVVMNPVESEYIDGQLITSYRVPGGFLDGDYADVIMVKAIVESQKDKNYEAPV